MRLRAQLTFLVLLVSGSPVQAGGGFELSPTAVTGGGGASAGGAFVVEGTIGQVDVGLAGANRFAVLGGLWAAASTATLAPCAGDCGGDGQVVVTELVTMVRLSLSGVAPDDCRAGDGDENDRVSVDEVILAVNRALTSCF
jgi:hypothetical protein